MKQARLVALCYFLKEDDLIHGVAKFELAWRFTRSGAGTGGGLVGPRIVCTVDALSLLIKLGVCSIAPLRHVQY